MSTAGADHEPEPRRDRDALGRARNDRPRDGLGRPLPRGAAGVPRQAEGQVRTAAQTISQAQRLLDEQMPFHAHEVFEDAWKSAPAPERELWRALAQLAVGLTHAGRGNARGADALLRRAADNLLAFADSDPHGLDIARLADWSHAAAQAVREHQPLPGMPRLRGASRER